MNYIIFESFWDVCNMEYNILLLFWRQPKIYKNQDIGLTWEVVNFRQARIQEFSSGGVQPSEKFWQATKKKKKKNLQKGKRG